MSIKVISDVMRDPRYDGKQKLILVAIANAVNNEGMGFASHQQIQQVTDVSSQYIRQCMKKFIADGRLEIVRKGSGRGNATIYRLLPRADAVGPKRATLEQQIGELDAPFYDVDEDLKGQLCDHKGATLVPLKGQLDDAKRATPVPVKGQLGVPKRATPPSSPPSFTSLDTSSLEDSSLETPSVVTSLSLVPTPEELPASEKIKDKDSARKSKDQTPEGFDEFWSVYPRKVRKVAARESYARALRKTTAKDLLAAAQRYAATPGLEERFTAHAVTWLNQERWTDSLPEPAPEGWIHRRDGVRVDPSGRLWDADGFAL